MGMGKTRVRTSAKLQRKWISDFSEKEERGEYEPFYRTQDVTSSGFKARIPCPHNAGRVYHLLSQNETNTLIQLLHDPLVIDIKEQYPITDIAKSKAFAKALEIKHPKHVWSATDKAITFDFVCTLVGGKKRAVSVKPKHLVEHKRTNEKLILEKTLAESLGWEYEITTDEQKNSEAVRNIFRILRGANLPIELVNEYTDFKDHFVRLLSKRTYHPLRNIIHEVANIKGIDFIDSFTLMQHGFWIHDIYSDPEVALLPEHSPYYLGLKVNA